MPKQPHLTQSNVHNVTDSVVESLASQTGNSRKLCAVDASSLGTTEIREGRGGD